MPEIKVIDAIMIHWFQAKAKQAHAAIKVYRLAFADARTPRRGKFYIGLALVYLVSPLDVIPDWIPVIGWLDELVVVPLLLALARRAIPENVLADCRRKVEQSEEEGKKGHNAYFNNSRANP
ncbi:MAG: YkvA family protein [Kiritimatiellae bacterium]|nr:YkvA family protein [Kiritimatiellia bacterium]